MTGTSILELAERATHLASSGRAVLGITGCPGAGKSMLADRLVAAIDPDSQWVARLPMDGFHLADAALERLGRRHQKGAINTFDAYGYLSMLRRLRVEAHHEVYAPDFEREVEQPIAGSIVVGSSVRLVITEGNYLLADAVPWPDIRAEMTEVWYVDVDDGLRRERLISRHVHFGKSVVEAQLWVDTVDEMNARLVRLTRERADLVVDAASIYWG